MTSTYIDLLVLVVAGIVAGNGIGSLGKEISLGTLKNTAAGAVGGAGGYFLQGLVPLTVDAAGNSMSEGPIANHLVTMALIGLAAGGLLTMVLGFASHEASKRRSP
jgi:hypothetical protein